MRPIIAKITLDNRTAIIEAHPDSIEYIANFFKVLDTSKCWVYGKFRKELAVSVSFLTLSENNPTGALLPIGLLPTLIKILNKLKAKYKIIDTRREEKFTFTDDEIKNSLPEIELRDYQIDAVKACLNNKNGIVKSATGSGKTIMFSALAKLMKEKKILIFFKKIDLAHQTMKRMKASQIDAGIVQGKHIDEDHRVVMVTVQSAHKLNRTDYDMVVVDEVHNASGEQYQQVLKRYDFEYRYGFSATPIVKGKKLKNYKVKAWLGDIIFDIETTRLIDAEHLARPIITFLKVNKVIKLVIKTVKGENVQVHKEVDIFDLQWAAAERGGIVNNIYRNKMIKTLANSLPGTVLTLVKYVDSHGVKLHEVMEDALFLSGQNKRKEREEAIRMLENNEIKTIIASTIFDEGIDVSNITNVILAGGGQSYIKTLQRVGRGMRLLKDEEGNVIKNTVKVYDFYDETHPILEKHSKERIKFCEAEGYDVRIKEINLNI